MNYILKKALEMAAVLGKVSDFSCSSRTAFCTSSDALSVQLYSAGNLASAQD